MWLPTKSDLAVYADACAGTYAPGAVQQWTDKDKDVHVYLCLIDGVHTFAWEGTTDFREWMIDFIAVSVPCHDHPLLGPVHLGFLDNVLRVMPAICAYLQGLGWPDYDNTGHSKGGECLLFHGLMKSIGRAPRRTAAFESPRVGGPELAAYLASDAIAQTRTRNAHGWDVVTQVPFADDRWCDVRAPLDLIVPDSYDIPTKHRIPAVQWALAQP